VSRTAIAPRAVARSKRRVIGLQSWVKYMSKNKIPLTLKIDIRARLSRPWDAGELDAEELVEIPKRFWLTMGDVPLEVVH